jgi:transcriptional regulator with XRE-family HTH domain
VIRKPTLLAGPEIAFLRSELGLTGRALAKTLGVVQESVSRWENDALPVSATVDHLMRTMVALTLDGEKFPVDSLATIAGQSGPLKLVVRVDDKGSWSRAA